MFNVKNALEEKGHTIIPFSINYPNNVESDYSRYFVTPLDASGSVYFNDHSPNIKTYVKTVERLFYSKEVERALLKLIEDTKPDIAYVLHYLRKLSPAVICALKKKNISIVVRLSDYQMLCPQAHCLRDDNVCDICVGRSLYPSIKYKCVKNSKIASALNVLSTKYHRSKKYFDYIDRFILTNNFAKMMMIKGGYNESKLEVIPTFVNENSVSNFRLETNDYITYVGRLDPTKGVDLVIRAFQILSAENSANKLKLIIIGDGGEGYVESLKNIAQETKAKKYIEFRGHLEKKEINIYLKFSLLNIVASRWYENLPNVILESYSAGTPVIASNIGSLPESVIEGKTGALFEPGNHRDLALKIKKLLKDRSQLCEMSNLCRQIVYEKYSKDIHISKLVNLFSNVIGGHSKNAIRGIL